MIPNWVFLAIPLALLGGIGTIIDSVKDHKERVMLHYIFDGDRVNTQHWNWNQKCMMNHERRYL